MNYSHWQQLNTKVRDEFLSYRLARQKGQPITNASRFCQLILDALSIAAILNNPTYRKKFRPLYEYRNGVNGTILPLGPAAAILSDPPDPTDIPEADCSIFFFRLMRGALDCRAPIELFVLAFNYSNQLLERFQNSRYFLDARGIEALEADIRKKLMTPEFAAAVVRTDVDEHPLIVMYRQSIRRVSDTYMRNGDYAGAVGCLIRELDRKYVKIRTISNHAKYEVIFWLYYYNHLLGVLPSDEIPSQIQKRKNQLEDWQVRRIEEFERPDIAGVELKQMSIRPTEGYIPWEARTTLLVSLPKFLPNVSLETDEGEIRIASITDPFVDPNFLFLHRQPFVVNGMPLAILSPAIGRADDAIIVEISIPRPFYPGIDLDHQ